MLDLGIEKLGKKIILEEKWLDKHFGSDTKFHNIGVAALFILLVIKMYIQGDLKTLISNIKSNGKGLGRTLILVSVILVVFRNSKTINLSFSHACFAIFFHIMSHTGNVANIFWFSLISMYYFNSSAAEE
jgi:hypothetical protein